MSRLEVDESRIREVVLVREDRTCPKCRARMRVRCRRTRNIHTLEGPVRLIVKLVQCRNEACDSRTTFPGPLSGKDGVRRLNELADKECLPTANSPPHPLSPVPVAQEGLLG
jgi:hypothetical protein